MSLSTFFQQIKTQIKSAISTHPIEIFMIAAFALGIWFVDMNSEKDHLAYWLFEPMLFAFIYLSRPYAWYRFSWIVPLIAVFTIWQVNDNADFYAYSPKFWGAQFIVLLILCGFPFVRNNQAFTYRNFTSRHPLLAGGSSLVWSLQFWLQSVHYLTLILMNGFKSIFIPQLPHFAFLYSFWSFNSAKKIQR